MSFVIAATSPSSVFSYLNLSPTTKLVVNSVLVPVTVASPTAVDIVPTPFIFYPKLPLDSVIAIWPSIEAVVETKLVFNDSTSHGWLPSRPIP